MLRMVIENLIFYPDTPVNTSVLWANVGESLTMGFLSEDKELFHFEEADVIDNHAERATCLMAHKKTVPLYIGMTTGFCGILTPSRRSSVMYYFWRSQTTSPCRLGLTRMLHYSPLARQERQHPMAALIS